jgi:fumarylacetoacetase
MCIRDSTRRMSPTGDLPPSFKSLPIAYHSRSSSVRASGHDVIRPNVQYKGADGTVRFGPEPSQDFELELGCLIGPGNELGSPIPLRDAGRHVFGYCLVNDWSSRAIQRWESQPLGPFLGKSLCTSISPWIITAEAMAPFRAPAHARDAVDAPPEYLQGASNESEGGLDLAMSAFLLTPRMRSAGIAPQRITHTNFIHCYWTFAQMLVHHASNGCNLQPGDLLGSGTISGPEEGSRACLAEINARGSKPIDLPGGEQRLWLEDGDEVIFRANASREGHVTIGFGECRGRIAPALSWPA